MAWRRRRTRRSFVFDLGGGTFDVSVLDVGDASRGHPPPAILTWAATTDERLVHYLATSSRRWEGVTCARTARRCSDCARRPEKAKVELSSVTQTNINLPYITATQEGAKHLISRITRAKFEDLTRDLVYCLRRSLSSRRCKTRA